MCKLCHDAGVGQAEGHLTYHPEADRIYEDYDASAHGSSINSYTYVTGSTTDVKGSCSKCHTHEGGKLYKDVQGGYDELVAELSTNPAVENATDIQCGTCHDPHDPDQLLKPASGGFSAEYRTCDPSNERVCRDCHNVHAADNSINNEWANSAHGGHILQTIDSVTGRSSVTQTEGGAWMYYDYKTYSGGACTRCHTSTGFKNLATSPSTYNPANNDFSYLTSNQKEMLYCWACHTDSAGGLRDPGAFVNVAPYSAPVDRISAVPDINGSNQCMSCHSGRLNGQFIKDYGTITGKNFSTFSSHYLADGGILYRTIGYEYASLDYSNVIGFAHDKIGTTNGTDGNDGPCVGCHMVNDDGHADHTWEPLEKDGSDQVTDIQTYSNVCSKCHSSKATLISALNTRDVQYKTALAALDAQLQGKGIYFCENYPYFKTAASCGGGFYTAWPNKDTLGAAFNYFVLDHIPAAYVHNREYTRKLIYDSIDFLDNGAMDKSVEATLGGSGDAYDYLNGTR
ncbi:MAG: hypothetical protein C4538_08055 [Nitrospiraceae bacterium]|nr:MAG: hypothetical protein C4538_08055 [Nitrospiraceae bacterium]